MDRSCTAVRVQHVPASHPYARSVTGPGSTALPDPPVPGAPQNRWWPPQALEPSWIASSAGGIDVIHLHFGFEHLTPAGARAWVTAVRRAGLALLFTVHDLVNPHLVDQRRYEDLLDVLVPAADELTTLSVGAAEEIRRRWGRHALTHRHPHVVAPEWLERPRSPRPTWTVGVHLKSLRANMDLDAVTRAIQVVPDLGDALLRVHVHEDVTRPDHPRYDPRLLDVLRAHGGRIDVRVHRPLDDHELWSDLLETDLALLPYLRGTHSGWLEMCHDLGTDVLAGDVGHLGEQRPVHSYTSPDDLTRRLVETHAAHRRGERPARAAASARLAEAAQVTGIHARLYRGLSARAAS